MDFKQRALALWQHLSQSIGFRLGLGYLSIFIAGLLLIWAITHSLLNQLIEETVNEYGKTVAEQLAQASVDDLVRADLASLQIQLDNLTKLDTIISAAIYDVENRTLVQAGSTPNERKPEHNKHIRHFPATVTFDKSIAGKVIVVLNTANLHSINARLNTSLTLSVLMVILLTLAISYWLGQRVSQTYTKLWQQLKNIQPEDQQTKLNASDTIRWNNLDASLKGLSDYLAKLQQDSDHTPGTPDTPSKDHSDNLHHGSYAELLIECTNLEDLQAQISHRDFSQLLKAFQHCLTQSKTLYHGHNIHTSGNYVYLRFYAAQVSEAPFQATCCALMLYGLIKDGLLSHINANLKLRMAVNWREQNQDPLPDLLANHINANEFSELQFLCEQGETGAIIFSASLRQFSSIAEHIRMELLSDIDETDCYRFKNISDNYLNLLNKQIKQLKKASAETLA